MRAVVPTVHKLEELPFSEEKCTTKPDPNDQCLLSGIPNIYILPQTNVSVDVSVNVSVEDQLLVHCLSNGMD